MSQERKKAPRRYDVDWLRVCAVFVLILIHTAAMFDPYPITSVKGSRSFPLVLFATFVHEWRLAILFIASGAGSYFALGFLTGREFVRMRFKRILIPLVVGTLLVVPVHLYYWQFLGNPGYQKSYLQFYATIIYRFFRHGAFGTVRESLHWAHLWFLAYLFVASLVALPLFLYLRREAGRAAVARLAGLLEKRFAIFLLALPIIVVEAALRAPFYRTRLIIIDDWANFFFFLVLFVYGFLIFSDERIRAAVERHRKAALLAGVAASAAYVTMTFTNRIPVRGHNADWTLFMALRGFNVWCWCVAIVGFAGRHLNFNHRALPYANEAVYPVYILHLPIATAVAYHVVRWPIGVAGQFAVIILATLAASLFIYEFIIRRTNVTRFLFGLKLRKKEPADVLVPTSDSARN